MGERRGVYRIFLGKPEGKISLERPRHGWEDNIEMEHQKVGCGGIDWIGLTRDRDRWRKGLCALKEYQFPCNSGTFLTSREPVSISERTVLHGVVKLTLLTPS
jgi:hypothetical protein